MKTDSAKSKKDVNRTFNKQPQPTFQPIGDGEKQRAKERLQAVITHTRRALNLED